MKLIDFSNVRLSFSAKQVSASTMYQVDEKVKKIRADILRRESKKILHKVNKTIGKCSRILFESHGKSYADEFLKLN